MSAWTFCHIADIHLGSPRSFRFDPSRNENWATARKQMSAISPELLLIGGDVTRDGFIHEFEYELVERELQTLPFPYHVIPGNMDVGNKHTDRQGAATDRHDVELNMTSQRLSLWSTYFGPINWTFVHRDVRFTGFYAAVAGSGLPEEKRFWDFMSRLEKLPHVRHHVAMMHYVLFMDRLDEPQFDHTRDVPTYLDWYFSIDPPHRMKIIEALHASGVEILLSGHIHCRREVELIDGIRFYKTPSGGGWGQLAKRWPDADVRLGFHRLDVSERGIDVAFVPIDPVAPKRGYGPMGHPPPDKRDYSQAWEKVGEKPPAP